MSHWRRCTDGRVWSREASVSDALTRAVDWMSDVLEWLCQPVDKMPTELIMQRLPSVFETNACSLNWRDGPKTFGMIMNPADILLREPSTLEAWQSGDLLDCHGLMAWYDLTKDPAPQTLARVPTRVVPRKRRILVERPLARIGIEHQLSMVYESQGLRQRAFVVARGGRDYNEDDLMVARYVQRSLVTLDRQSRVLSDLTQSGQAHVLDLGMTGREVAVMQLIGEGHSTRTAARRLSCSPRTIEKHLEHGYRKLGVRDRLNAIRVARLAGIITDSGKGVRLAGSEPMPSRMR